jgi:hypothetical protein
MEDDMAIYQDLKITNDDLALDSAGNPVFIYDRDVIAQDIRHALRESGVLFGLIGESRPEHRNLVFNKLHRLIENDARVIPGSSVVTALSSGQLLLEAQTEFGPIDLGVTL